MSSVSLGTCPRQLLVNRQRNCCLFSFIVSLQSGTVGQLAEVEAIKVLPLELVVEIVSTGTDGNQDFTI